jgi:septum formation protein
MSLILASASPRRQQLLAQCGVPFEVCPADLDESPQPEESASALVQRLALAKAQHVQTRYPADWVLGADTMVVLDGDVLGKPRDDADAEALLHRLSGRRHQVLSAVALVGPGGWQHQALSSNEVVFAELSAAWIRQYVASGEPMDKAGAYAIQGGAATRIVRLEGSHSAVVGLPLYETAQLLEAAGLIT